jgi:hypothetical protein
MTLFQAIADRTSSSATTGMTCTTCAASIDKSLTKALYAWKAREGGVIWTRRWLSLPSIWRGSKVITCPERHV